MSSEYAGLTELQWIALQSTSTAISTLVLFITVIFGIQQLRQTARNSQFDAVLRLQEIVDGFRSDREQMFKTFPLSLALEAKQFALRPPDRHTIIRVSEGVRRSMLLTPEQQRLLEGLTLEQIDLARRIINRLNDLGQLLEDGFIPKDVFFGKYHVLVLRCCHLVEPARRRIEDETEGGNYGQRLLRLRHRATLYNDIYPKHRDVSVYIQNPKERCLIYKSPRGTFTRRIRWTAIRLLSAY